MLKIKHLLVAMVVGLLTFSTVSATSFYYNSFDDVTGSTNYYKAIMWAANAGVATGYPGELWKPENCVSRAELLKMIAKTRPVMESIQAGRKMAFQDVESTDWYYTYVSQAYALGYIDGYADGFFRPNKCVNRAEAIKIATNSLYSKPDLSDFWGVVSYDDKLVIDVRSYDWFAPYMNFLFKKRVVGSDHTVSAGYVERQPLIKFFPAEGMSRKEVAEMLYRISIAQKWITDSKYF